MSRLEGGRAAPGSGRRRSRLLRFLQPLLLPARRSHSEKTSPVRIRARRAARREPAIRSEAGICHLRGHSSSLGPAQGDPQLSLILSGASGNDRSHLKAWHWCCYPRASLQPHRCLCLSTPTVQRSGDAPPSPGSPRSTWMDHGSLVQTPRGTKLLPRDVQGAQHHLGTCHPTPRVSHPAPLVAWGHPTGAMQPRHEHLEPCSEPKPNTAPTGRKNRAPKTSRTEGSEAFIYVRIYHIFVCVTIHRYLHTYTPHR